MAGWMAYTAGLRASRQWGGTQAAQHQFLRAPTFTLCATVVHKTSTEAGGQRPLGSSREVQGSWSLETTVLKPLPLGYTLQLLTRYKGDRLDMAAAMRSYQ